jgi:hypothetical protein
VPAAQPPETSAEPERIEPPRLGEGKLAGLLAGAPVIGSRLPRLSRGAMTALTAGSVLAVVGLAWLYRAAGGILLLGGVIGLSVVAGAPTARVALRPVAALGRAAAPLGLVLLVFIAAGTIESPVLVQLAVGVVTLVVAWYGLLRSEWRSGLALLRGLLPAAPASIGHRLGHAAGVTLVVGVPILAAIPALDALEDRSETSAYLFLVAVGLFVAAALLRLVSYASTRLRALVAIAVVLALARLAIEYGVLPGYETVHERLPWLTDELLLLVAGAAIVLAALTEIATTILLTRDAADGLGSGAPRVAAALEGPVVRRSFTEYAAGMGLLASGLAALALLAAVIAAATVTGAKERFDEVSVRPIAPGQPARAPASMTNEELAQRYSPVLVFTENQRWSPTRVDEYLAKAEMEDWKGRVRPAPAVDALPDDCPGIAPKPCYELTIDRERRRRLRDGPQGDGGRGPARRGRLRTRGPPWRRVGRIARPVRHRREVRPQDGGADSIDDDVGPVLVLLPVRRVGRARARRPAAQAAARGGLGGGDRRSR